MIYFLLVSSLIILLMRSSSDSQHATAITQITINGMYGHKKQRTTKIPTTDSKTSIEIYSVVNL